MANRTAAFRMADRLAGGKLVEIVGRELEDGFSPEQITFRLFRDFGIEVSGPTLRRWVDDGLFAPESPTAAEATS